MLHEPATQMDFASRQANRYDVHLQLYAKLIQHLDVLVEQFTNCRNITVSLINLYSNPILC